MKKEIAISVINRIHDIEDELISAVGPLVEDCSDEEANKIRLGLGKALMGILEHILKPIYLEYPDLIPPKLRPKDGGLPYILR